MKRLLCIVLMLSMIFTMFTTASAMTIAEGTAFVPNPMDLQLVLGVGSRESGTENLLATSTSIVVGQGEKKGIDYSAKLDMSPIRALFEEGFIQIALPNDDEARAEFEAGTVNTTVNVLIEYPAAAIIDSHVQLTSKDTGVLTAGSIFSETARVANGNTLKITYVNKTDLGVKELQENVDSYLKDIEFALNDVIAYAEEGNHIVKVTLAGETVLKFASKNQRVIYSGTASNVVNVAKDNTIVNHALEVIPVTPATCFTTGLTEGIICRTHNSFNCGALGIVEQVEIPKLAHIKIHVDEVAATCTSKGVIEHFMCTLCKSNFDTQNSDEVQPDEVYITPKAPHNEISVPAVPATCTTVGFEAGKKCRDCGTVTKAQKTIPALGHSEITIPAVPATCTETGKTQGIECGVCHTVLVAQNVVPEKGHKFGAWNIVTEATETTKGLMERICLNGCGEKETREIEKKPHVCLIDEKLAVVTKEPTCTDKGELQNYCECGKAVGEPVEIPAKGHTTVAVAGTPATCVTEGVVDHYTCVVCDLKFRDEAATKVLVTTKTPVDKNNHGEGNFVTIKGLAPTCKVQGLTDGEKCKNCNIVTIPQEIIPLVPHTLVVVNGKEADCENVGVKEHKHCKVCDKDFDMAGTTELAARDYEIPALGHNYGPAVKEPENQIAIDGHFDGVKRCTNDGCSAYIAVKIAVTPENCTHPITMDVIVRNATCTIEGEKQNVCLSCGETEITPIPMTAHNLVRTDVVQPTCHTKGTSAYYTCSDCGKMFDATDATKEITEVPVLDEIAHEFRTIGNGNNLQCIYCKEIVHVKKKDKDGNEDTSDNIKVKNNNVGIKKEKDKVKEDAYSDIAENVTIESEILINEREEISSEISEEIEKAAPTTETVINTAVWDIEINKVTTYEQSGEVDKETVKEIDDLIEIIIKIPAQFNDSVDFLVHRLHVNEQGQTETHIIKTTPDPITGEYIVIDKDAGEVTLKVKKFSEYVLVGYSEVVNEDPAPVVSGGGSASRTYTVQFKANGGTTVNSVRVANGDKITAPATTREGYTFAGWYTTAEFTEKFDFTQPITRNMILYAKWESTGADAGCDGTEADGCVSLKFKDVDTSLWYHLGIDYAVANGLMVGVETDMFDPDANITRGMLVTVLGRIEGVKDIVSVDEAFTDVNADEYYANYINWAVKNGVVYGYGEGLFGPEDFITREQIAAIIYRYAQLKGYDVSKTAAVDSYSDYNSISEYAIPSAKYVVGSGLMKGKSDTTFNPVDNSTRAEIATILYRFIEANK